MNNGESLRDKAASISLLLQQIKNPEFGSSYLQTPDNEQELICVYCYSPMRPVSDNGGRWTQECSSKCTAANQEVRSKETLFKHKEDLKKMELKITNAVYYAAIEKVKEFAIRSLKEDIHDSKQEINNMEETISCIETLTPEELITESS